VLARGCDIRMEGAGVCTSPIFQVLSVADIFILDVELSVSRRLVWRRDSAEDERRSTDRHGRHGLQTPAQ
jgi:hypothetical protein